MVATPIGNLEDASPRVSETLAGVDVIAAEDTRRTGQLLDRLDISGKLVSLHDHNEAARTPALVSRLTAGGTVALVSDAGTPTISDPGYRLVAAAHAAGVPVSPVPGPCALVAALSVAGLATDRFAFEGFLPAKAKARRDRLAALAVEERTMVFYESPRRASATLADMEATFGAARPGCVARELTKTFETVRADTLRGLASWLATDAGQARGEWVIVVEGAPDPVLGESDARRLIALLVEEMGASRAARVTARFTGLSRRRCYALAEET